MLKMTKCKSLLLAAVLAATSSFALFAAVNVAQAKDPMAINTKGTGCNNGRGTCPVGDYDGDMLACCDIVQSKAFRAAKKRGDLDAMQQLIGGKVCEGKHIAVCKL
jgi:hypothetical protein